MFERIFKAIFVICGVLASVWKVFIKFHWHGQNTTWGRYWSIWSNAGKPDPIIFGLTLLGWPNFFVELGCIGTSVCIWVLYNEGLLDTNRNAYSEEAWREKKYLLIIDKLKFWPTSACVMFSHKQLKFYQNEVYSA